MQREPSGRGLNYHSIFYISAIKQKVNIKTYHFIRISKVMKINSNINIAVNLKAVWAAVWRPKLPPHSALGDRLHQLHRQPQGPRQV